MDFTSVVCCIRDLIWGTFILMGGCQERAEVCPRHLVAVIKVIGLPDV